MCRLSLVGHRGIQGLELEVVEAPRLGECEVVVRTDRDVELLLPVRIHVSEEQRVPSVLVLPPSLVGRRHDLAPQSHEPAYCILSARGLEQQENRQRGNHHSRSFRPRDSARLHGVPPPPVAARSITSGAQHSGHAMS